MADLRQATSAELAPGFLKALRRLLDDAFAGNFSEDDWSHAMGGFHLWLEDDGRLLSYAAIVERRLTCGRHAMRVGYVEAVATASDARHQGHSTTVMTRAGAVIRARYPLGALSSGLLGFYERLGWERWRGATFVEGPAGPVRTPDDDGGVLILRTPTSPSLDLDGPIVCDWRPGDVW
jgi:aminoglycoside 2'-N-acetyltransferase I